MLIYLKTHKQSDLLYLDQRLNRPHSNAIVDTLLRSQCKEALNCAFLGQHFQLLGSLENGDMSIVLSSCLFFFFFFIPPLPFPPHFTHLELRAHMTLILELIDPLAEGLTHDRPSQPRVVRVDSNPHDWRIRSDKEKNIRTAGKQTHIFYFLINLLLLV